MMLLRIQNVKSLTVPKWSSTWCDNAEVTKAGMKDKILIPRISVHDVFLKLIRGISDTVHGPILIVERVRKLFLVVSNLDNIHDLKFPFISIRVCEGRNIIHLDMIELVARLLCAVTRNIYCITQEAVKGWAAHIGNALVLVGASISEFKRKIKVGNLQMGWVDRLAGRGFGAASREKNDKNKDSFYIHGIPFFLYNAGNGKRLRRYDC
jgi:hypothetical protein